MSKAAFIPVDANQRPLPGLTERLRLDKVALGGALFKTRALAADEIDKGRIMVNEQVAKASRELKAGDRIDIRQGYPDPNRDGEGFEYDSRACRACPTAVRRNRRKREPASTMGRTAQERRGARLDHRARPPYQARPAPTSQLGPLVSQFRQ